MSQHHTLIFELNVSLLFSHAHPESMPFRCPETDAGQSSSQNMASSLLPPESMKRASCKNAYCASSLLPPVTHNKNQKGGNLFFLEDFLMWEGIVLLFKPCPGFVSAMEMRLPVVPFSSWGLTATISHLVSEALPTTN